MSFGVPTLVDAVFILRRKIMFDNIGGKIKGLAAFWTWFGIIVSVIVGFVFIFINDLDGVTGFLIGFLIVLLGSLASWLSSLLLYGFGELINNTSIIAESTSKNNLPNTVQPTATEQPKTVAIPIATILKKRPTTSVKRCPYCGQKLNWD